ncbi:MAG: hypothetical protein O2782_01690 [bacterium]|nr:hypothetical protein [bacterium]
MSDHGNPAEVSGASRAAGHEVSDADAKPLVRVGIALAVIMLVGFLGMLLMFRTLMFAQPLYDTTQAPHPLSASRTATTGPRLQPDPPRQKAELRLYEDNLLMTYDWIDQEGKVARIPITRAIEILAASGLPKPTDAVVGGDR